MSRWAEWDEVRDALVARGAVAQHLDKLSIDCKRALVIHIFDLQHSVERLMQERDDWRARAGCIGQ